MLFDICYELRTVKTKFQYAFSLKDLITGLIDHSPFCPLGHLYLFAPTSFLYITLCFFLGVPGSGELFHQ